VYRDGARLGETPFAYESAPAASTVELVLKSKGYRDAKVSLVLDRDREALVQLSPERPAPRPPRPPAPPAAPPPPPPPPRAGPTFQFVLPGGLPVPGSAPPVPYPTAQGGYPRPPPRFVPAPFRHR
jgi:hypothetical protein